MVLICNRDYVKDAPGLGHCILTQVHLLLDKHPLRFHPLEVNPRLLGRFHPSDSFGMRCVRHVSEVCRDWYLMYQECVDVYQKVSGVSECVRSV